MVFFSIQFIVIEKSAPYCCCPLSRNLLENYGVSSAQTTIRDPAWVEDKRVVYFETLKQKTIELLVLEAKRGVEIDLPGNNDIKPAGTA